MREEEIAERVKVLLVDQFELKAEDLSPDATLYEKLELDSLDSVDLVVALEKEFGFKIVRAQDEGRISAMRRLNEVYGFIESKLAEKGD
jgi:acyl carrier protein